MTLKLRVSRINGDQEDLEAVEEKLDHQRNILIGRFIALAFSHPIVSMKSSKLQKKLASPLEEKEEEISEEVMTEVIEEDQVLADLHLEEKKAVSEVVSGEASVEQSKSCIGLTNFFSSRRDSRDRFARPSFGGDRPDFNRRDNFRGRDDFQGGFREQRQERDSDRFGGDREDRQRSFRSRDFNADQGDFSRSNRTRDFDAPRNFERERSRENDRERTRERDRSSRDRHDKKAKDKKEKRSRSRTRKERY